MSPQDKPRGLIECIHYVMAEANDRKFNNPVKMAVYPHLEFAFTGIEASLGRWHTGQCSPIKGADAAVKALAEACVRDRKIAKLKAELAKLEAE